MKLPSLLLCSNEGNFFSQPALTSASKGNFAYWYYLPHPQTAFHYQQ